MASGERDSDKQGTFSYTPGAASPRTEGEIAAAEARRRARLSEVIEVDQTPLDPSKPAYSARAALRAAAAGRSLPTAPQPAFDLRAIESTEPVAVPEKVVFGIDEAVMAWADGNTTPFTRVLNDAGVTAYRVDSGEVAILSPRHARSGAPAFTLNQSEGAIFGQLSAVFFDGDMREAVGGLRHEAELPPNMIDALSTTD